MVLIFRSVFATVDPSQSPVSGGPETGSPWLRLAGDLLGLAQGVLDRILGYRKPCRVALMPC